MNIHSNLNSITFVSKTQIILLMLTTTITKKRTKVRKIREERQ